MRVPYVEFAPLPHVAADPTAYCHASISIPVSISVSTITDATGEDRLTKSFAEPLTSQTPTRLATVPQLIIDQ